jgi:hypothetical protein
MKPRTYTLRHEWSGKPLSKHAAVKHAAWAHTLSIEVAMATTDRGAITALRDSLAEALASVTAYLEDTQ